MRSTLLSFFALLCLVLAADDVAAVDRWVYLGDVKIQDSPARGRLSINLDSLRKRARHYEIWERIVVDGEPRPGKSGGSAGAPLEQMTLWAIRCRFGEMARVTTGSAGSFEPRAEEPLRFYSPRPGSPGASVIDTACIEAKRVAAELRALQPAPPVQKNPFSGDRLDAPPSIFDQDAFEYGEE